MSRVAGGAASLPSLEGKADGQDYRARADGHDHCGNQDKPDNHIFQGALVPRATIALSDLVWMNHDQPCG